ncbi:annexin D3-like isoform X2 [Euphorbia lathyris]|uniref:annexin D3-like isoform X2 n=1 Tax=Euphorbia lathyris TaxID=212925 RepID=UPI00331361E6
MSAIILPDVVPPTTWDCESLRKAIQGNDKKTIIKILGHRTANQRKVIRETYEKLYKESLIDNLQAKLSGDFGKAVIWWTYDPAERDAKLANDALKQRRVGAKQLQVIVEIACASSPKHLQEVRKAYCSLFECSLEEAITSVVSMPLRTVLLSLVRSFRHDKDVVNTNLAEEEAKKLHKAIKRKHLDNEELILILSIRNVYQLRATFQSYKQKFGSSIDQDLKNCGKGDLETLLRVAVLCIGSPTTHFAEVIGGSIIGLGTDEDTLSRAIIARAEIDMANMRPEYLNIFKHTMDEAILGDTSGDYKDFLMTLTGQGI